MRVRVVAARAERAGELLREERPGNDAVGGREASVELAAFAEQAFADLSCPPTLEQYDPESADPASQSATNSTTSGTDPSAGTSGTTQEPPAAADSPDRDENVDVDATKFM
jgi:hypothetical protein